VRLRRRRDEPAEPDQTSRDTEPGAAEGSADPERAEGGAGPHDVAAPGIADVVENDAAYVDLGALRVKMRQGVELRINTDPASGAVIAVVFATAEGSVELRVFAAPRSGGVWEGVRAEIAEQFAKRGGSARERDGAYGVELMAALPVTLPDGRAGAQPSRIVGVEGPRWLLRATFLGRPALQPDSDGVLESALRDVVVVRGTEPMAPREPLVLRLPANAQPYTAPPD
jgi:hypothetical protein